jgi:arylsulfatase A
MTLVFPRPPSRLIQALATLSLILMLASPGLKGEEVSATRPNIILILADDVGAETLGAYGGDSYDTPRLDKLAGDGVKFLHGYAQPLGTPSRVKLITGLHNSRNYETFGYLDPDAYTFAHLLKSVGYSTAVAGVWELSVALEQGEGASPVQAGFDDHLLLQIDRRGVMFRGTEARRNGILEKHDDAVYTPELLSDYVVEYVSAHLNSPFFIYYPMALSGVPLASQSGQPDNSKTHRQKYAAMVRDMDTIVGKIQDAVFRHGLDQNTVIIFVADNGAEKKIVSRVGPKFIRGGKGGTTTAGIRVPFLAWGPGYFEGGRVSRELVDIADILPTLGELAGVRLPLEPKMDGLSLMPLLTGENGFSRESLFMYYKPFSQNTPIQFVFNKRYKLYASGEFFDLVADPMESSALDLAELGAEELGAYEALTIQLETAINERGSRLDKRDPAMEWGVKAAAVFGVVLLLLLWIGNRRRLQAINKV